MLRLSLYCDVIRKQIKLEGKFKKYNYGKEKNFFIQNYDLEVKKYRNR